MNSLLKFAVLAALVLAGANHAHAATCTVNALTDTGTGTGGAGGSGDLRYCITQANSAAGADTISVALAGTVSLTSSLPVIPESLTINGPGQSAFIVDGMDQVGIAPFRIQGAGVTVTLTQLTITRGHPLNPSGGGITVQSGASLTLARVTVSNNTTQAENGGGIFASSAGTLTVTDSLISGNHMSAPGSAGAGIGMFGGALVMKSTWVTGNTLPNSDDIGGAGIMLFQVSSARIENSTISNNINGNYGAGIQNNMSNLRMSNVTIANNSGGVQAGGLGNIGGTAILRNCTLVGNSVTRWGGAIYNLGNGAKLTIANTIIADNSAGIDGQDVFNFAIFERLGRNVIESPVVNSGSITGNGEVIPFDPHVYPLVDRGGVVPTVALLDDSNAINSGIEAEALDTLGQPLSFDARGAGYPRVVSKIVDIGAFEAPERFGRVTITGKLMGSSPQAQTHTLILITDFGNGEQHSVFTNLKGEFFSANVPSFAIVEIELYPKVRISHRVCFHPK